MIKKIVLGVLVLLSSQLFSQENTASPYSYYGIGSIKFKGTNDIIALGGLSVYSDSININVLNPASYANQMLTSIKIGGTSTFYKLNSNSASESAKKTSLDYLVIGIPYNQKLGFTAGLIPHSTVGYRLISNNLTTTGTATSNTGSGGMNKVFFGTGYQLTKKISFGFDFNYLFGSIDSKSILLIQDAQYATKEVNNSNVSGFAYNIGFSYQTRLVKDYKLYSSLVYSPKANLNSINQRSVGLINYTITGNEIPVGEDVEVNIPNSRLKLPSKYTIGVGLGNKKWFFGADYMRSESNAQLNRAENYSNVTYSSTSRVSVGGFYIPKFDSFQNYFERVTYKAGFRYENTGLIINNTSIKDKAVSFGFAFPINGTFSNISIGSEIGSKGTSSNGLIKENYFTINIGLMFSDKWFRKNLYN